MRALRVVLLACGVLLLGVLVMRNDPATVAASIGRLSWRLLVIAAFPFTLITICDTLGWRFAFRRDLVPFRTLLLTRLAGEAFNMTTPTASVGGEPIKAWLLRPRVPYDQSLPSVIVAKTTITMAQGALLVVGIACAWLTLPSGSAVLRGMQWLLVVEVLAVGGFVLVQVGGVLGGGGRLLGRLGLLAERSNALVRLDGALSHFYRREPRRLFFSVASHFLGWMLSAGETYLILHFLGVPVPLVTAVVIEAFGTAVRFATFMVPASLGTLEGGYVAIFTALDLGAATGLSFSLVRRVREAAWIGVGFIGLAMLRPGVPPVSAAVPEA